MKRPWLAIPVVIAAALALALAACRKSTGPGADAPTAMAPMPAEVFAVMTLPSVGEDLPRVAAYIDQIAPGQGAALRAELEETLRPDQIDATRPVHLVVLTPPPGDDDPQLVVVATARDVPAGADEWVMRSGSPDAVALVFDWATTSLFPTPAPKRATGVLYAAPIRARWADELQTIASTRSTDVPAAVRDVLLALVEQTDNVRGFVELASGDLVAEIVLTPRPGTTLASLVEAQRPSTFALLERLPLEQPLGAMAGHLALGDFSRQLEDLAIAFIGAELAATSPELNQRLIALVEALFDLGTGEYAGVTDIAANAVVNAFGVQDAARVGVAIDRVVEAARRLPMPPGIQLDVQRSTHAGVAIDVGTLFAGAMAAASGAWAAWDGTVVFALTDPDGELVRATVDGTHKPPTVAPDLARALADARERGDSLLSLFDVLPGDEYPIALSLGVRAGSAYLWARVPAAQAAALAQFRARDGGDD
mgnify:CR=1 FL=1